MARARYFVTNAAERVESFGRTAIHRVASSDTTDGLLLVFIWIGLAVWAAWALGRQEIKMRFGAASGTPVWLRERLKLPRRLTPIGVPKRR